MKLRTILSAASVALVAGGGTASTQNDRNRYSDVRYECLARAGAAAVGNGAESRLITNWYDPDYNPAPTPAIETTGEKGTVASMLVADDSGFLPVRSDAKVTVGDVIGEAIEVREPSDNGDPQILTGSSGNNYNNPVRFTAADGAKNLLEVYKFQQRSRNCDLM